MKPTSSPTAHRTAPFNLRHSARLMAPLLLVAALGGCATSQGDQAIVNAATTPLNDLNLVHAAIPEVLAAAQRNPYGLPASRECAALNTDIHALDEVLGADLDTPATDANPSLLERGGNAAGDAAVGALQRTTEGIIPFRGWIRKLSGAERHSRRVIAAITAGTVRRAFLKGLRVAQGCGEAGK